jgi:PKD repeat protein
MQSWSDDRAVAVQVGAIILFAFVVIAIAGYQASVVPNQNKQIEYNHNQEIQGQLQELEGTIGSMPATRERRTVTIDLGTSYPARTIFVNPPRPTGRLDVVGTRNGTVNFTVDNALATNPDIADFWNGSMRNYSTGAITYRPNYNVYGQAPVTVIENSLVYNEFDTAIIRNQQSIFDGESISLVALRGSLQENSGTASVNVRPVSASTTTVPVKADASGNVTISIVSRLSPSRWNESIAESEEFANQSEGGHVVTVSGSQIGTVDGAPIYRVEFVMDDGVTYDLQLARVGVGDLSANESETNASYAVAVTDSVTTEEDTDASVTVEVRDQYDNPKSGVTVNATVDGSAGTIANSPQTTNDDGRVIFRYETTSDVSGSPSVTDTIRVSFTGDTMSGFDESAPENVTAEVTVQNTNGNGLGGGGGGGGAYNVTWQNPDGDPAVSCSEAPPRGKCAIDVGGNDYATVTLTMETDPTVDGANVSYAVSNRTVGTVDPTSGTVTAGTDSTTLNVTTNGTVYAYVSSGDGGDRINFTVRNVGGGGGGGSNSAPTANFTDDASSPSTGDTISFDASGSSDSDGTIESYEWDFDGDGTTDDTGAMVTHSYSDDGTYTVTLTITDDDGATDTETTTIQVDNSPPFASFTNDPSSPVSGESVEFEGSGSGDSDGSITTYEWDFNGNGTYDVTTTTPNATHVYDATGTYDVKLRVTDDDGATATETNSLTVTKKAVFTAVSPDPEDGSSDATEFVRVQFPSSPDTSTWTIEDDDTGVVSLTRDYDGEFYFAYNKTAFVERWGISKSKVVDIDEKILTNSAEHLRLKDGSGTVLDEVAYVDGGSAQTSNGWNITVSTGEVGVRNTTGTGAYEDTDSSSDWRVENEEAFFGSTNAPPGLTSVTVENAPLNQTDAAVTHSVTLQFNQTMNTSVAPTVGLGGLASSGTYNTSLADNGRWLNDNTTWVSNFTLQDDDEEVVSTVEVAGAEDEFGKTMTTDSSKSVVVDTIPPTITRFEATNPSSDQLRVELDADEPLSTIEVGIEDSGGTVVRTLTRSDFSESCDSVTCTYTNTSAIADGDYTAVLNTSEDAAGNDGASGETSSAQIDTTPATDITVDSNRDATNGTTTNVSISYTEANPGTVTLTLSDGAGNSATFSNIDDSGYAGDNSEHNVSIDLSNPDSEAGNGIQGGTNYSVELTATDGFGNSATNVGPGTVNVTESQAGQIELSGEVTSSGSSGKVSFSLTNNGDKDGTIVGVAINDTGGSGATEVSGNPSLRVDGSGVESSVLVVGGPAETLDTAVSLKVGQTKSFEFDKFEGGDVRGETITVTFYFSDGSSKKVELNVPDNRGGA